MRTGRRCLYITNYGRCVSDGRAGSTLQVRTAVSPALSAAAVKRINDVCYRLSDITSGDHNATTRDRVHDAHEYTVNALVRALADQPIAYHRTLHSALYLPHSTHRSVMVPFVMPPPRAPVRTEVSAPTVDLTADDIPAGDVCSDSAEAALDHDICAEAALDHDICAEAALDHDEGFGSFSLETGWSF